jgi:excisionase family DNA binding protein
MITPREIDEIALRVADLVAERLSSRPVDGLIDTAQAAELLGCSKPTIERWTKDGVIPSVKIGGLRRYRPSELLGNKKGGCDE